MPLRPFSLLVLLAAALPTLAAEGPRPFAVDDLVALRRLGEFRVSPEGGRIVYALSTVDLAANKRRVDLWLVDADGSGTRQLTHTPESEASPRWAPDGKAVYFLAKRGGETTQVFRLPLDGGEASPVTRLPLDVGSFAVSPDGQRLLVSLEVYPDCADLACTVSRTAEKAQAKATGKLYGELLFRHWDDWEDGLRSHVFAVTLGAPDTAIDLMKGMDADCPTKPFGGDEDHVFTPDGKGAVLSAKDVGREAAWSTNFDLFHVPVDGSAAPRKLTAANAAWDTGPVFSADGKWLAYRAMKAPGYENDRWRILVRAWPSGTDREVAPKWDRSPGELRWSPDGKTLYAVAEHLGRAGLFAVDVATGAVKELTKAGTVEGAVVGKGKLVFAKDDLSGPADLFGVKPDGSGLTQLTKLNADLMAKVRVGAAEPFTFAGWNGETVHAWLVKPADFDPARKWPVAFLIHGGPQGSFGDHWHYRWNPQTYAGAGYAAVMVDFHGSTGYGQAFTDSIGGDWGGKPLEDLQKGLAAALAKYPFLDGERVAALGASYGGYMINWIAGAWPDRFRCLVSHDGNLDEQFAYFDTEELWFPEREHGGPPWENPEGYQKHNPLNLVKNWKTPILVVHGGKDFRVVETQGMATFTAAQRKGVPSQLLYFPDENHWVLKPHNSIQWHRTVLGWLDQWTKTPAVAK
jgi:dipeptidyl aminopeptidase/acylaminoacyl peptidase